MILTKNIDLEKSLEFHRRIASGEISPKEAIEQFVAAGGSRELAGRMVAVLTGQLRERDLDPETLPGGSGL